MPCHMYAENNIFSFKRYSHRQPLINEHMVSLSIVFYSPACYLFSLNFCNFIFIMLVIINVMEILHMSPKGMIYEKK